MTKSGDTFKNSFTFDDVLLVPKRTSVKSRKEVLVSSYLTKNIKLNIPIISANTPWCTQSQMGISMAQCGGIGFIHRMQLAEQQANEVAQVKQYQPVHAHYPQAALDPNGRLLVGAAIGVKDEYIHRADLLVRAGADVLLIDVAHGHSDQVIEALLFLKKNYPHIPVIAGNVATGEGTRDLIEAGADAVKVGIGPGGVCTTRIVTGCGVPQITAILECSAEAKKSGIPLIADGGIRASGDIVKALAAGASSVMLGSLLAGTTESSAHIIEQDGQKHKISTGFTVLGMELTLKQHRGEVITQSEIEAYVPEGVEVTFADSGPVALLLTQLVGGIRSGMSYCGSKTIEELWQKAEFRMISGAAWAESKPHVRERAPQLAVDYHRMLNIQSEPQLKRADQL